MMYALFVRGMMTARELSQKDMSDVIRRYPRSPVSPSSPPNLPLNKALSQITRQQGRGLTPLQRAAHLDAATLFRASEVQGSECSASALGVARPYTGVALG
jgi:hypothetical protein